MKKLLTALSILCLSSPVLAIENRDEDFYYSNESMGCLLLGECTDGVEQVWGIDQIKSKYPDSSWSGVEVEFARILNALTQAKIKVFLAPEKYFPVGTRGSYHTVSNNFYLNESFMHRPNVLMTVMRHEGWHAAQDCMAGTLDNSMIAIIHPEESVPRVWVDIVRDSYPASAVPWEAEAKWAGVTQDMTMKALEACAAGNMWEVYEPTPLTREWLEKNGYIK